MPRAKPTSVTPEEQIIGYFVTKDLDRVQEMLSHLSTIVRSRTMHMRPTTANVATGIVAKKTKAAKGSKPAAVAETAVAEPARELQTV